jgi:hypothetical protein
MISKKMNKALKDDGYGLLMIDGELAQRSAMQAQA